MTSSAPVGRLLSARYFLNDPATSQPASIQTFLLPQGTNALRFNELNFELDLDSIVLGQNGVALGHRYLRSGVKEGVVQFSYDGFEVAGMTSQGTSKHESDDAVWMAYGNGQIVSVVVDGSGGYSGGHEMASIFALGVDEAFVDALLCGRQVTSAELFDAGRKACLLGRERLKEKYPNQQYPAGAVASIVVVGGIYGSIAHHGDVIVLSSENDSITGCTIVNRNGEGHLTRSVVDDNEHGSTLDLSGVGQGLIIATDGAITELGADSLLWRCTNEYLNDRGRGQCDKSAVRRLEAVLKRAKTSADFVRTAASLKDQALGGDHTTCVRIKRVAPFGASGLVTRSDLISKGMVKMV